MHFFLENSSHSPRYSSLILKKGFAIDYGVLCLYEEEDFDPQYKQIYFASKQGECER